jgi:alpha-glucosidase (family GH31 glycosyl hydrolase)
VIDGIPQEPWAFTEKLVNASRKAILNRYSVLPYFYTQYYKTHVEGGALIRALPLEFPFDISKEINYIDTQFMVGPALMISPVLKAGAEAV